MLFSGLSGVLAPPLNAAWKRCCASSLLKESFDGFERRSNYVKKLAKEIPDDHDIHKQLLRLELENSELADYAVALIGAALLELSLKQAILARFLNLAETEQSRLFSFERHGPLAEFGARIQLGYALGLFGSETREDLASINRIRNAFAHHPTVRLFSTPEIKKECDGLFLKKKIAIAVGGGPTMAEPLTRKRTTLASKAWVSITYVIQKWEFGWVAS